MTNLTIASKTEILGIIGTKEGIEELIDRCLEKVKRRGQTREMVQTEMKKLTPGMKSLINKRQERDLTANVITTLKKVKNLRSHETKVIE